MSEGKQYIHLQIPARICLYGDHQDYLGLPVITCAINRYIYFKAEKIKDPCFEICTPDVGGRRLIWLEEDMSLFDADDHYKSGIFVMQRNGYRMDTGYRITISGNIPINAGLSSSSAIVVGWILFLHTAFKKDQLLPAEELGKLAFEAEVEVHNAPGGKMDQYAIALGGILFMNMGADFSHEYIHAYLPSLIIGESGEPKQTNKLLARAKEGALEAISEIEYSRKDFLLKDLKSKGIADYLPLVSLKNRDYFKAAVINHETTREAYAALSKSKPDFTLLGKVMNRHHHTLKEYLGTTTPRIDRMVEEVIKADAYGAKIVGSGGGGCVVALSPQGKENDIIDAFKKGGAKNAYQVHVSNGAIQKI